MEKIITNQTKSWWILFIVSLGVIIPFIAPYLTFDPTKSRVEVIADTIQYPVLVAHIIFAFVALITGFFQFFERIRLKRPILHRYIGRMYMVSVLISGLLAFFVLIYIENFTKVLSFLVLTILWLFTSWKGYRTAVKKQFQQHQAWMIRSFGITLIAVSARLLVPILLLAYYILNQFSIPNGREAMIEEVLNVNIWVGLVLNFVICEWLILRKQSKG